MINENHSFHQFHLEEYFPEYVRSMCVSSMNIVFLYIHIFFFFWLSLLIKCCIKYLHQCSNSIWQHAFEFIFRFQSHTHLSSSKTIMTFHIVLRYFCINIYTFGKEKKKLKFALSSDWWRIDVLALVFNF